MRPVSRPAIGQDTDSHVLRTTCPVRSAWEGLQLMKEPGAQALEVTQACDSMLLFMYTPLV
jgi:hypothetical protein